MLDESILSSNFYISRTVACSYLPNRNERLVFTVARSSTVGSVQYNELAKLGFRRSRNTLYRPHCPFCTACRSVRIRVNGFQPSRSQRRIRNRNRNLQRIVKHPVADREQFALFRKYLCARHENGQMCDFDYGSYTGMIEESPVKSCLVLYVREDAEGSRGSTLVAAALTDVLKDGLSMVYSFFDPDIIRNSLGTHVILDHVQLATELGLDYVYLGYWVPGSDKMDYKAKFSPLEFHDKGTWKRLRPGVPWIQSNDAPGNATDGRHQSSEHAADGKLIEEVPDKSAGRNGAVVSEACNSAATDICVKQF